MTKVRHILLALLMPAASALAADVVVNDVRLEDSTRQALERSYGIGMIGEGGGRGAVFVDGKVIMTPN